MLLLVLTLANASSLASVIDILTGYALWLISNPFVFVIVATMSSVGSAVSGFLMSLINSHITSPADIVSPASISSTTHTVLVSSSHVRSTANAAVPTHTGSALTTTVSGNTNTNTSPLTSGLDGTNVTE